MLILGIETSCDETSAALVTDSGAVLSNVIASSRDLFAQLGGVIPEEAARKQVECMLPVLHEACGSAGRKFSDIDCIAVTRGPGLLGSLIVGTTTARMLGALLKRPVVGIHHTLGHLSSPWLHPAQELAIDARFPLLTLSASGGHTDLWLRQSHTEGALLGSTRDDAAGEAFDKGASLLSLPYPGGPAIARIAETGNADAFPFPLPLERESGYDFSFSGLKTALKYTLRSIPRPDLPRLLPDLAASYERAICAHLLAKLTRAAEDHRALEVHLVGGVSANQRLRTMVSDTYRGHAVVRWPQRIEYCTDNAAMIAAACGFLLAEQPQAVDLAWTTDATLPLSATFAA